MILILGGTTEGRNAVQVAEGAGKTYYYSTVGKEQEIDAIHAVRLTGGMTAEEMEQVCRENGIRLLIDAAHPFAIQLHQTIAEVSELLQIPVVRLERRYPPRDESFIWCRNYDEAAERLEKDGIRNLLALSGVKTIAKLRTYWKKYPCWFRILQREQSVSIAETNGFPRNRILFYQEGADEYALLEKLAPDAILTKESGDSGFFSEKVEAARRYGIPVYVIQRPSLPETFIVVRGIEGLRKAIERILPDFFPLRSGYTTGTCATAAAKAALLALLTKTNQKESDIELPSGELVTLPIDSTVWDEKAAICTVIKNSGDDPDVTNGCSIVVRVESVDKEDMPDMEASPFICFKGGEGVGTVTLPGLGLEVGGPAINATPRKLITNELTAILKNRKINQDIRGVVVTISVPEGKEIASRTFNPKLGIVGGISIIGTSGIVRPFSNEAFIASIKKEAEVANAIGCPFLVINSGAKSERLLKDFLSKRYTEEALSSQAFIHYGNFIGETLKIAYELGFEKIILGIMIGKAVKLAEGALDTHSKKVVMNRAFLKEMAVEAGCDEKTINEIGTINLARELWALLSPAEQRRFFPLLLEKCRKYCGSVFPEKKLSLLLIDEAGEILYTIGDI